MAFPPTVSSGFGKLSVRGASLVAYPAASIMHFIQPMIRGGLLSFKTI